MGQDQREMDGEGSAEVEGVSHETVRPQYSLQDQAEASGYLRMKGGTGCAEREEVVLKLVRVGAPYTGAERRVARTTGPSGADDRRKLGGFLVSLDSRYSNRLHGRSQ